MSTPWFKKSSRRLLLDMHVDDWNPAFLSQFDAKTLVDNLRVAHVPSLIIPANTHAGLCYWPTQVGIEHANVKGKDIMGQVIDACHAAEIDVILYYCTIYIQRYGDLNPDAHIVDATGYDGKLLMNSVGQPRRFEVVCPNHDGYREFVVAQLTELCEGYDFEGVWPDMTFWPTVCYCESCQARYQAEEGREIPRTIDWRDGEWLRFQRARQRWVTDFCYLVTDTIKSTKPTATVAHQSQTFTGDWLFGPSVAAAKASDWLSSDYYGNRDQLSLYAKLFYGLSSEHPFEHLNAWCWPNIHEHTVQRTPEHLRAMAFAALANHGAEAFIDAIDPAGTLNHHLYEEGGKVFADVAQHEVNSGGTFVQDVAIYFSFDGLFDVDQSGQPVASAGYNFQPGQQLGSASAHRNGAIALARQLMAANIAYGVITRKDLASLERFQAVLLPNVALLDNEEMAALRTYVTNGGSLYASNLTSLIGPEGARDDFGLADLLGVHSSGERFDVISYVAPAEEYGQLFAPFTRSYPATLWDYQVKVEAASGAEVLATVVLPYTDPQGERYGEMLTDPPGIWTESPSVVLNRVGKGQVLYCAGALETWNHAGLQSLFRRLLGLLLKRPLSLESNAPVQAELTLFHQPDQQRYVVHMLNFPADLALLPLIDLTVRLHLPNTEVTDVMDLVGNTSLAAEREGEWLVISVPRLDAYLQIGVTYQVPVT